MTFSASLFRGLLPLLAGLALSGCIQSARSPSDEEKEPHFLAGKSRFSTMDYRGAIESFEKALEVNPHSGAAHFELACLLEQKETADPAAAIYHFERYLKLRPNAGNVEIVRQQIMICKQELAKTVSLGPVNERVQREFEQIAEEKKRLTEENKRLREDLEKCRAYLSRLPALTNQAGPAAPAQRAAQPSGLAQRSPPAGTVSSNPGNPTRPAPPPAVSRSHTVKAGETLTMIARQYGIKVETLIGANPGLNPRRLHVGQALTIPAR
jgi:tetratricopeptide (TPR) repeat protein